MSDETTPQTPDESAEVPETPETGQDVAVEQYVLPACERYGMGAIVWSPLDGGWLTGRYRKPEDLGDKSRLVAFTTMRGGQYDRESEINMKKFHLVDELSKLAADAGLSLTHLAMAFSLEHPAVTASIIGPRTREQLDDVMACADARLDTEILDGIDRLVPPGSSVNGINPTSRPWGMSRRLRRRAR